METNRLKRVKRGLYYAVPPDNPKYVPVRNIIAYYAAPEGYLGYLEALRCYGVMYLPSAFYVTTCVLRKDYFDPFEFNHVQYCPFIVSDAETDIQEVTYGNTGIKLRASSPERTFVDCIDRPRRARGWEAFFKSFVGLKNLDLEKVVSILKQRDNQMLIRKTGLVLELLGYESF
jgi:predicted transcriptional regulator of viral defense system